MMPTRHGSPRPLDPVVLVSLAVASLLASLTGSVPMVAQTEEAAAAETAAATTTAETRAAETPPSTPESPEAGTFTDVVDVRVVNVDVFVTDPSGEHVPGLTREYFELLVDGEPMPISNFYYEYGGSARESAPPLDLRRETTDDSEFTPVEEVQTTTERRNHVVILVDHARLGATNRKRAFEALREAIAQLDPKDLIAVVGIRNSLVFYSDFLFDRQAIGDILDDVSRVSMRTSVNDIERRQILGELARGMSGGIVGRTALAEEGQMLARIRAYAADEYARSIGSFRQIETVLSTMAGVPGRKILFYVGEGIPTRPGEGLYVEWRNRFGGPERGMRHYDFNTDYTREIGRYDLTRPMEQLAGAANRADVTLYAVDAEGNHGFEMRSALTEQGSTSESVSLVDENFRAPLEYTTQATGGRLLRSSGQLPEQLGEVFADLDNFYSLGFLVPSDWRPGSEHDIRVKVRGGRKLTVRHRQEVRVPEPNQREAAATVAGLLYHTVDNPLGIRAKPGSETARDDGTAVLPVLLEIPVGSLELIPRGEVHAASLSIYVSVKDQEGNPGPVQRVPFHLNIPNEKVEQARGDTAHYTLPLVLRPGDRQVAITVRDDVDRSLSTIRLDIGEHSPNAAGSG